MFITKQFFQDLMINLTEEFKKIKLEIPFKVRLRLYSEDLILGQWLNFSSIKEINDYIESESSKKFRYSINCAKRGFPESKEEGERILRELVMPDERKKHKKDWQSFIYKEDKKIWTLQCLEPLTGTDLEIRNVIEQTLPICRALREYNAPRYREYFLITDQTTQLLARHPFSGEEFKPIDEIVPKDGTIHRIYGAYKKGFVPVIHHIQTTEIKCKEKKEKEKFPSILENLLSPEPSY